MQASVQQGVVVVVLRDGRYLMIRRGPNVIVPAAWCFVGGAIEPGETQEQAVVREFREEVGGVVRPIRKVWEYGHPSGRLWLHWWLAELDDDDLAANPDEVAEIRWCTPREAEVLPDLLEGNRTFLDTVGRELMSSAGGRAEADSG